MSYAEIVGVCVCVCVCAHPHQLNGSVILPSSVLELDAVAVHVREVLLGFCGGAGPQTFVVLYPPRVGALRHGLPAVKLRQAEEALLTAPLGGLHTTVRGGER